MSDNTVQFDNPIQSTINVTIVQNSGGGLRVPKVVDVGTTLGSFINREFPTANSSDRVGVLNRAGVRVTSSAEYVLQEGDTITFTPTSMKAA